MRGGKILGILLVVGLAGSGAVLAGEVVHFTNGTFMPIKSHIVEGEMVRVVLTSDSEMAFPVSLVEKIDAGGRDVIINQVGSTANVVEGGARGGARGGGAAGAAEAEGANQNQRTYAVTGSTSPSGAAGAGYSAQQRAQMGANPGALSSGFIQNTEARNGPRVSRPFADSNHPGRRAVSKVGDRGLYQKNAVGSAGNAQKDAAMRGASLQPGGGTGNSNNSGDQ
jgi:hypothetical protein